MGQLIMKTPKQQFGFNQKLLVLTLLAAFGPANAADDEIAKLIKPDSAEVSVGLGMVNGDSRDRTIFGQYNGWRKDDAGLLLDFDYIRRDEATGLWTNAEGRNIGQDNRELSFSQQKQGDWKYSLGYSELVRHEPRTVTTGTGSALNFDLSRKGVTLGAEKWLSSNLLLEANFKSEKKEGTRLSGVGSTCSNIISGLFCTTTTGALLMLPEPIDSTTQQFEAKLNYSGDNFLVSGGYYGSFYNNAKASLNPSVPATLNAGLIDYLQQPVALAPDNQAHQFYVSGNYRFSPATRANFHLARTHATQNQDFGGLAAPGLPGNLDAVLDSTLAQLGLTARPMQKVSLLANWRYEEIEDKTPLALYSDPYTNTRNSSRKANGKAEASYQLLDNYRATVGVDYAFMERDRPVDTAEIPAGSMTALREWTEEGGYRLELKRSMSETFNATFGYVHSEREGERWMQLVPGYPVARYVDIQTANGTFPATMMDRKRDKGRILADWNPSDTVSLQFTFESGKDNYTAPTQKGLHDTGMKSFGVDVAWTLSDDWKMTGYLAQSEQTLHVDHNWGYMAALENVSTSAGMGIVGKPSAGYEIGADLSYLDDNSRYDQAMSSGVAIVGALPDVVYRVTGLKFYGKYALDKNADLRLDLIHQRVKFSEWTWSNFVYADNASVSMQPNQNVTFLGARYIYKFR
jgi:MtrB/PioB family decaheme-associated outer membrane protein